MPKVRVSFDVETDRSPDDILLLITQTPWELGELVIVRGTVQVKCWSAQDTVDGEIANIQAKIKRIMEFSGKEAFKDLAQAAERGEFGTVVGQFHDEIVIEAKELPHTFEEDVDQARLYGLKSAPKSAKSNKKCDNSGCFNQVEFEDDDECPWCIGKHL